MENVQIGDKLFGYDHNFNRIVEVPVVRLFQRQSDHYYIIETLSGKRLFITAEHPLYTNKGYVKVKALKEGDVLFRLDGNTIVPDVITGVEKKMANKTVYNLHVSDTNNYFAEGILAHNKGGAGAVNAVATPKCCCEKNPESIGGKCDGKAYNCRRLESTTAKCNEYDMANGDAFHCCGEEEQTSEQVNVPISFPESPTVVESPQPPEEPEAPSGPGELPAPPGGPEEPGLSGFYRGPGMLDPELPSSSQSGNAIGAFARRGSSSGAFILSFSLLIILLAIMAYIATRRRKQDVKKVHSWLDEHVDGLKQFEKKIQRIEEKWRHRK